MTHATQPEEPYVKQCDYHMVCARELDDFPVGALISKCCEPYDTVRFRYPLSNAMRLRYKHYDAEGRLQYAIMAIDRMIDSAVYVGAKQLSGWIDYQGLLQAHAMRPVNPAIVYKCDKETFFVSALSSQ